MMSLCRPTVIDAMPPKDLWIFLDTRQECPQVTGLQLCRVVSLDIIDNFSAFCFLNHRLRGSASPVLTATHHSYGSLA